jgi:uncharacterized membrane protein
VEGGGPIPGGIGGGAGGLHHRTAGGRLMVTRADIEAKARELEAAITQTKDSAQNSAVLAGVVVAILIVVAFLIGRHRRGKTVVEVYKL